MLSNVTLIVNYCNIAHMLFGGEFMSVIMTEHEFESEEQKPQRKHMEAFQQIIHLLPILTHADLNASVTDTEKFTGYQPSRSVQFKIKPGEPFQEGSAFERAVKTGKRVMTRVTGNDPAKSYIAVTVPVFENSRVIGTISAGTSLKSEMTIQNVVESLYRVTEEHTALSEELTANAQALEEKAGEIKQEVEKEVNVTNLESTKLIQQAGDMNSHLKKAVEIINKARDQNSEALDHIGALQDMQQEISSAAKSIEAVAKQSNILSINASIEAARAGEHGKGFAVVAEEMGKLAQQTSELTGSIGEIAENSKQSVANATSEMSEVEKEFDESVKIVNEAIPLFESVLEEIHKSIQTLQNTSHFINNTTESAETFSKTTQEIATGIEEIEQTIQQLKSLVEVTAEK